MTPEEKANELFNKFHSIVYHPTHQTEIAKQCAIICCDEFIKYTDSIYLTKDEEIDFTRSFYWEIVKQIINEK